MSFKIFVRDADIGKDTAAILRNPVEQIINVGQTLHKHSGLILCFSYKRYFSKDNEENKGWQISETDPEIGSSGYEQNSSRNAQEIEGQKIAGEDQESESILTQNINKEPLQILYIQLKNELKQRKASLSNNSTLFFPFLNRPSKSNQDNLGKNLGLIVR